MAGYVEQPEDPIFDRKAARRALKDLLDGGLHCGAEVEDALDEVRKDLEGAYKAKRSQSVAQRLARTPVRDLQPGHRAARHERLSAANVHTAADILKLGEARLARLIERRGGGSGSGNGGGNGSEHDDTGLAAAWFAAASRLEKQTHEDSRIAHYAQDWEAADFQLARDLLLLLRVSRLRQGSVTQAVLELRKEVRKAARGFLWLNWSVWPGSRPERIAAYERLVDRCASEAVRAQEQRVRELLADYRAYRAGLKSRDLVAAEWGPNRTLIEHVTQKGEFLQSSKFGEIVVRLGNPA